MFGNKGTIESERMTPDMVYRGWNTLAVNAGFTVHSIRQLQEEARARRDYETADKLRKIADDLAEALEYLDLGYSPPKVA